MDTLFDSDPDALPAPHESVTERVMLDLLHERFGFISQNGASSKPRYVCAEHVRARSGFDTRTLDFVAVDTWASGKLATHGVEIKVSRSDWLRERKDPFKSAPFLKWTTHFWLAVPDLSVAKPDELPEGWGLLVRGPYCGAWRLTAKITPPRQMVAPIPPETLASLLYAVQKTAVKRAVPGGAR
jgi:hypothetical protein